MRPTTLWTCLVTVSLLWLEGAQTDSSVSTQEEERVLEDESQGDDVQDDKAREGRIFAYYTSTSITRVQTVTISAISTCLSTVAGAPACAGRRKRRFQYDAMVPDEVDFTDLDSSKDLVNMYPGLTTDIQEDERTGRKLTIWSTGFTTVTVTSTSAITGTTATASLLCMLPGVMNSCFLG